MQDPGFWTHLRSQEARALSQIQAALPCPDPIQPGHELSWPARVLTRGASACCILLSGLCQWPTQLMACKLHWLNHSVVNCCALNQANLACLHLAR
jgi:hypothetical protein